MSGIILDGTIGKDKLIGTGDTDTLNGYAGDDWLRGYDDDDLLNGDAGNDTLYGDDGNDTLNGGGDDDWLRGYDDDDLLNGDAGNDTLYGDDGNDTLNGGSGNDTLNGGNGDDLFVFTGDSFGQDTIKGFTAGLDSGSLDDVIEFRGVTGFASFADVIANASDNGSDTTITLDSGNHVVLRNVLVSDLVASDFRWQTTNSAPVILTPADLGSITRGGNRLITAAELLAFAGDVDGDDLSITSVTVDPALGLIESVDAETWRFTPSADLVGLDAVEIAFAVSDGTDEIGATAVLDVLPVDDASSDSISVIGEAAFQQTLQADTSALGATVSTFTYQWQSSDDDGASWSNITGADSEHFDPDVAQLGMRLRVVVEYTAADGSRTMLFSAATSVVPVLNIINLGTAGNDSLGGSLHTNDLLYGDSGNDTLNGGFGRDTLYGGSGNDTLEGSFGRNLLSGGAGNDRLNGGWGDDTLDGGVGDDNLSGAYFNDYGSNLYIFTGDNFGQDTIWGFTAGLTDGTLDDVIAFRGVSGFASFADVIAHASDDGTDTTITLDSSNHVVLADILVSDLVATDFRWETTNTAPVMLRQADLGGMDKGGSRLITAAELLVFAGDVDDEDVLSVTSVTVDPALGIIELVDAETWRFTPNGDIMGLDLEVSFTVSDSTNQVTSTATIDVLPSNDPPSGDVTITGTAGYRQVLTADTTALISAGAIGEFIYQWQSSDNGTSWSNIASATSESLEVGPEQLGSELRVAVEYTAADGSRTMLFSAATTTVPVIGLSLWESFLENNVFIGGAGNDTLDGDWGDDSLDGGAGNDRLSGSYGDDSLNGGDGNDTLDGSLGDDVLDGGDGSDSLSGGTDSLFGSGGNNTFVFTGTSFGNDTITDFDETGDVIVFNGVTGLASFEDVLAKASDDGSDTTITLDAVNSVVLKDVLVSDLGASNFRIDGNFSPEVSGPVALDPINEDTTLIFTLTQLLANASDMEGDVLSVSSISVDPSVGTIEERVAGEEWRFTPVGNYTGTATITYVISDGKGGTATATAEVEVAPVNDPPVVDAPLSRAADEDSASFIVNLLEGASDVDIGDVLSVDGNSVIGVTDGLSLSADKKTLTVDPSHDTFQSLAEGVNREIIVTYDIEDDNGGSVAQSLTVAITGTNDDPVVTSALLEAADEDSAAFSIDLLEGASDVDLGDVLSVGASSVTGLVDGLSLSADNQILTVDPGHDAFQSLAKGENREIIVSYDIEDDNGGSVGQSLTLTITGTNDDPVVDVALSKSADEDSASFVVDLLEGALDVDVGDMLSVENVTGLVDGLTLSGTSLTVDPSHDAFQDLAEGVNRVIPVTYDIEDGQGGSVAQTLILKITGTNDDPVVDAALSKRADEDSAAFSVNLLEGASDVDLGDVLSVTMTSSTLPDGLTLSADNQILTVDPGHDTFQDLANGANRELIVTYDIEDDYGGRVAQSLTLTITGTNDAPVAVDDAVTTAEDTDLFNIDALTNDTDPDTGDTKEVDGTPTAIHGTVTVNADGTLKYSPDENFNGTDTITYTVRDSAGETDTGAVTVTVTPVNDAPVVTGSLIDGDPQSGRILTANTSSISDADGLGAFSCQWQYSDDDGATWQNIVGATSDSYKLTDSELGDLVRVQVSYTDGSDNREIVNSNATSTIGVLIDTPDGAGHFYGSNGDDVFFGNNTNGAYVTGNGNDVVYAGSGNSVLYGENGNDSLIAGAGNDTLRGVDGADTLYGGSGNDLYQLAFRDGNSDRIVIQGNNSGIDIVTAFEVYANDGTDDIIALDGVNGINSFDDLQITEIGGVSRIEFSTGNQITVYATGLTAANFEFRNSTAPTAVADAVTINEDSGPQTIDVVANDTGTDDTANEDLTLVRASVDNGTVEIDFANNELIYTPNDDFSGQATITYEIYDDQGNLSEGSATVTVNPLNDAPVAVDDAATTNEDAVLSNIDVLANDTDPDTGDTKEIDGKPTANHGTVTVNADGTLNYTPDDNFNGTDKITYSVKDSAGETDTGEVTVTPVDDAPDIADKLPNVDFDEDTPFFSFGIPDDVLTDADGEVLTFKAELAGDSGLPPWLYFSPVTNAFFGVLPENLNGSFDIEVTAEDAAPNSSSDIFTLTINPVNDPTEGKPVITGTLEYEQTITADTSGISDADGLGAFSYQWERSEDGGATWSDIAGATAAELYIGPELIGWQLRAEVSHTDGGGTLETVTSAATALVPVNVLPINIWGTSGDDYLTGYKGADDLYGLEGNDTLYGLEGNDELDGGTGRNVLYGGDGNDFLVNGMNGLATGSYLDGGAGNDFIMNQNGASAVNGGAGNDVMFTAAANTTFIFDGSNFGQDEIDFFKPGLDKLLFRMIDGLSSFAQVDSAIGDHFGHARITLDAGNTVTLFGVSPGELTEDDFIFQHDPGPIMTAPTYLGWMHEDGSRTITSAELLEYAFDLEGDSMSIVSVDCDPAAGVVSEIVGTDDWLFQGGQDFNGFLEITFTVTDGTYQTDATAALEVLPVNDAPTGALLISGTPGYQQTLTVDPSGIADADGLGAFSYQWQSSSDGVTWADVAGATEAELLLEDTALLGTQLRAVVQYRDGSNTTETVDSTASAVVPVVNVVSSGTTGNDIVGGTTGADTLDGGAGADAVYGNGGNDVLEGGSGNDALYGAAGADSMSGGSEDDVLHGGAGDDSLRGDTGSDTLNGGEGNDTLTGGVESDTFVFTSGCGQDTVTDFAAGEVIIFDGVDGLSSYADLAGKITDDGTDTTITIDSGNSILLENVLVANLSADDFSFV